MLEWERCSLLRFLKSTRGELKETEYGMPIPLESDHL